MTAANVVISAAIFCRVRFVNCRHYLQIKWKNNKWLLTGEQYVLHN